MTKKKQSSVPKELTRKQISRQTRDERTRRRIIYGTALVLGIVVLVLAYGLVDQYILKPRRPVAIVNGTQISREAYEKRLKYRQWDYGNYLRQLEAQRAIYAQDKDQSYIVELIDQQISNLQTEIANLPSTTLSELIDEEIYRQEAARRGISVTPEEVQYALESQFGYYSVTPTPYPTAVPSTTTSPLVPTVQLTVTIEGATPSPSAPVAATTTPYPTPTLMTKEQFDAQFSSWISAAHQAAGFTEADLKALIESALLQQKVQEALAAEVPTTAEQVHARHILFSTREEAEVALARIKAGEDFATLATELSTDTGSKANGGDLGWFTRGMMLQPFEDAAFSLPVGQVSDVVETTAGFHLILVEDHQMDRPLDEAALQQAQQKAINDWLQAQRSSPGVKNLLES